MFFSEVLLQDAKHTLMTSIMPTKRKLSFFICLKFIVFVLKNVAKLADYRRYPAKIFLKIIKRHAVVLNTPKRHLTQLMPDKSK